MDIDAIVTGAKRIMLKTGRHLPTLLIEHNGTITAGTLSALPDTTLEKKRMLFQLGVDLAMEHDIEAEDVTQLVWICEVWFSAPIPKEQFKDAPRPSQDPSRQEGLMVLFLTITDKVVSQDMRMVEVLRAGGTLDLVVHDKTYDEIHSSLLTSCLAGIVSATLSESELTAIIKKAVTEHDG